MNKIHTVHTLFMHEANPFPHTGISDASLFTLHMFISLMGTSSDSIYDLCVVFFIMLKICEIQETALERGFK